MLLVVPIKGTKSEFILESTGADSSSASPVDTMRLATSRALPSSVWPIVVVEIGLLVVVVVVVDGLMVEVVVVVERVVVNPVVAVEPVVVDPVAVVEPVEVEVVVVDPVVVVVLKVGLDVVVVDPLNTLTIPPLFRDPTMAIASEHKSSRFPTQPEFSELHKTLRSVNQ